MVKTRAELKIAAKAAIKPHYWRMVGVTLLAGILMMACVAINVTVTVTSGADVKIFDFKDAISILWSIFVATPVMLGLLRFYLNIARDGSGRLGDLFYMYKGGGFWNALSVYIYETVFVYLWTLLLIVPGIIKSMQYFMINYMLAENPNMPRKQAFEITKAGMRGHLGDLFVFGLSFLGWAVLGGVTLGIGMVFIAPYINAACVQFYLDIKQRTIEAGVATEADFLAASE